MRFSANLGFLYEGRDLPARVRAAARDGFDAVEKGWLEEAQAFSAPLTVHLIRGLEKERPSLWKKRNRC